MKRLLMIIGLLMALTVSPAFANVTASPYPNPYRQTMWNSITDSVNTVGQSPEQKQMTLRKLHAVRTRNRLQSINAAQRAKFLAKRQAWLNSQP